jgi:hypothetical protein
MKLENKLRKWTLSRFKRELWKYFALYIKQRDKYICFTCGKKVAGIDAQAGHFIPKGACGLELYFSEENVHCQCSFCNLVLQGNQYIYGKKLRIVAEKLYEIHAKRNLKLKYKKQDYLRLIEKYKNGYNN